MKRILPLFISFIFVATMFLSGCGELNRENELKEILEANEDSLGDTFTEEECDYSLFSDYIKSWAKGNKLEISYKGKHSTVLDNPATEGCGKEPSTVLLCSFNTGNVQPCLKALATGMTSLLGPEEHGDISLVIAEFNKGQYLGVNEIPDKYLSADNLINLQTLSSDSILTSGPNNGISSFTKKDKAAPPKYANAYEITMSMPEYTDPYSFVKENNYPNPINTIGSLLATFKSSGKLFDIASFTSKSNPGCTPYSATAVVVIDDNHVESFLGRFEKSYGSIEGKFEDLEEDFVYTCNATDLPESVLSDEVSNDLVSLMYTLNTGICTQDEESGLVYASSYINSINTDKGDLHLSIDIRTRGESYLDSLSSEYETTAGLCSTKYSFKKNDRIWTSDSDSALVKYFTECVPLLDDTESNVSIKSYENDLIQKRLPDQNMIIYTFETGNRKTTLSNITDFLDPNIEK